GHDRDRGAVDVGVEQSDGRAALAQCRGDVHRDGRLADAAFARRDGDRLLDARKDLGRFRPHERLSHVGRHPHVHPGDAGNLVDSVLGLRLETVAHRTGRRRQLKREADPSLRADLELFDHAEAHHVTAQVRVLDAAERLQDLLRRRRGHRHGMLPGLLSSLPMKQVTAVSPAAELIAYYGGPASDVYFQRAHKTLTGAHVDAVVTMDFFASRSGVLCGVAEAVRLLSGVLQEGDQAWAIAEGAPIGAKET